MTTKTVTDKTPVVTQNVNEEVVEESSEDEEESETVTSETTPIDKQVIVTYK